MEEKLISLARRKGWLGGRRVVCFALDGRRIISIGHNSYTRGSSLQSFCCGHNASPLRCWNHAEIDCLRKLSGYSRSKRRVLERLLLVVVRLNAKGEPVMAKPCKICQFAINLHGVKNVYWTTGSSS